MRHLRPVHSVVPQGVIGALPGVRDAAPPGSTLTPLEEQEHAAWELLQAAAHQHRLFRVMVDGRPRAVIAHVMEGATGPVVTPIAVLIDATQFEEIMRD